MTPNFVSVLITLMSYIYSPELAINTSTTGMVACKGPRGVKWNMPWKIDPKTVP